MALDIGIILTAVNNARNALRQTHSDVDKLGVKGQAAANKLRAIHVVLAGIATGGLAAFSSKVIKVTGDLEGLIFRLGVLEGGIDGAKERFNELLRTFGNAPVSLDAVVDGFVRLRAAGLSSIDAMSTMKSSVDAVAAFGGGTEELKRLSIGLQQVLGKGVLQMEEFRQQIGEAVPSAMRILAREMGISVAELVNRVGKGTVEAQAAVTKLRIGMDKDFGGIARALGSTTIKGALAQFQTNIKQAVAQAFIFDTTANVRAAALIRDIGEAISRLIRSIDNDTVSKFFNFLTDIANVAVRVGQGLAPVAQALFDIAAAIASMLSRIPSSLLQAGVIAAVLFGVLGTGAALIGVLAIVLSRLGDLGGMIDRLLTGYGEIIGIGGIIAYVLFGKGGVIGILASFLLVFSQLDVFADRISALGVSIQSLAEGKFVSPGTIFKTVRDLRSGAIPIPENAKVNAKHAGSDVAAAYLQGVIDQLKKGEGTTDAFKKRADADFAAMKKAYEDAQKRSEVALTPAGLSILGQRGAEELEKLERRMAIALQEGAGKKEIARILQDIDQVNKKFETSRQRLKELLDARGTRYFTEAQAAELGELEKEFKFIDRRLEDLRRNASKVRGAAVGREIEGVDLAFRKAAASAKSLIEEFRGDELSKQIADIDKKFTGVRESLEGVALRYKKVGDTSGFEAVKRIIDQINDANREAIRIAEARYAIEQKEFVLDQRRAVLQIQQSIIGLQRETRGGLESAFTSRFSDTADDRRAALRQSIIDTEIKIGELESKLLDPKLSDASRAALERHKLALQDLAAQTQKNIDATTAYALATQSLWQGVGDAIGSSLKDALKGFIKGTKNAEEVLLAFYDKITDAAIDYLFELAKILIKQELIAAAGGATGGGFFGFFGRLLGGFAKGGAFNGKVKAFADGGVIGGPTLFGLAGEAGKEGILPLDNVGGKLGVNASGMSGGGETHVHFHGVVDAETFFARNRQYIIGTIQQARRTNRNGGV